MLLDAIAKNNFVIVGRAGIDFYTDAGVRAEDADTVSVGLGGSAATIGAGICKLGGKAALVARGSDDSVGSYCIGQLKRYGVDASLVVVVPSTCRSPAITTVPVLSPTAAGSIVNVEGPAI